MNSDVKSETKERAVNGIPRKSVWQRLRSKWRQPRTYKEYSEWLADQPLPSHAWAYFDHLHSEYLTLTSNGSISSDEPMNRDAANAETAARRILDKVDKNTLLTWGDIYAFETAILRMQTAERLCSRAWSLRAKYRSIAGQRLYDDYLLSKPPDPKGENINALKMDLEHILGEFHWMYTVTPLLETIRVAIAVWVGLSTLLTVLLITIASFLYCSYKSCAMPTFAIVLIMGVLGAYVSVQRRLQTMPAEGDPIVGIFELQKNKFSICLAPISGAIFAALLYLMFIGGLVQGSLFPRLIAAPPPQGDLWAYLANVATVSVSDLAKLFVWSFISGFAERLVPDALDRLALSRRTSAEPKPLVY
jgi:hypothetical protein